MTRCRLATPFNVRWGKKKTNYNLVTLVHRFAFHPGFDSIAGRREVCGASELNTLVGVVANRHKAPQTLSLSLSGGDPDGPQRVRPSGRDL